MPRKRLFIILKVCDIKLALMNGFPLAVQGLEIEPLKTEF